jgi:hypothetical protein
MKRTLIVVAVILFAAGLLLAFGRPESEAVRVCRADAQKFAEETASYEAEFDSLYGATTLGQRSISDLLDRDKELVNCVKTDPRKSEQYKTLIHRDGDIEGMRYLRFLLDTNRMQDFAQFERNQQALQCVLSARLRSVRPGRHGSEAVTLRHPVMPVANGLGRGLVGINGDQL